MNDRQFNLLLGLGTVGVSIVLIAFIVALTYARAGEIAAALATVIGGSFVLGGAALALRSVQHQIASQERVETARRDAEIDGIERGFTSELLVYSRGIIQAASIWNQRARQEPDAPVRTQWPVYIDPLFYRNSVSKVGLLRQPWVMGTIIGFYSNLLELNDQAREALSGRPTVNTTHASVAARLHIMASNLAQALDGLNNDRRFPIPPDLHLDRLFMPDGRTVSQSENPPQSLQDVLLRLAGIVAARPA